MDSTLLFISRCVRMFAYGFLAVVLVLYLRALGYDDATVGLLLTLTLLGDTALSLVIALVADRVGRRRMLLLGAVLMALAGVVFAWSHDFSVLLIAAIIGVISPSGNEVGPFLAIEQAALAQVHADERRTWLFAWYNLVGSFATALGALAGGLATSAFASSGLVGDAVYRPTMLAYGVLGAVLVLLYLLLGKGIEPQPAPTGTANRWGLGSSGGVVLRLSGLFALDAFGGGFVLQSMLAYWFHVRFRADPALLGSIFFGANLLAGFSGLAAAALARRIGLLRTMIVTHLPSNVLLILVPLMPNLPLAIGVLLARFSISQMDVPTRQAYTMAVVAPEHRAAAAGVTGIARSIGASLAPLTAGLLFVDDAGLSWAFYVSGGIKIVYDLLLWRAFSQERAIS